MGLTLTLTDLEIPASPSFIEFAYAMLKGEAFFAGAWYRQEDESLAVNRDRFDDIEEKARFVSRDERGKQIILRAYRFFKELLTGNMETLSAMEHFQFFFVIGIPRTGGTYLTKQLFRASGYDYRKVQNALAHDGYPHLAHLEFRKGSNVHTNGLLQLGEYLTMVELFFGEGVGARYRGRIVVPKKFTKAVYYFDLIKALFGNNAHYLITLRHPLSMVQSVLDKSGGMPKGGVFSVRSAIERWALNDWLYRGYEEQELMQRDYVEVLLGYWQRFHYLMALSGVPAMPNARVVPFGQEYMVEASRDLFRELDSSLEPEEFKQAESPHFSDKHEAMAESILDNVEHLWGSLGQTFPRAALDQRY